MVNPLSANPTKWSNKLKQFVKLNMMDCFRHDCGKTLTLFFFLFSHKHPAAVFFGILFFNFSAEGLFYFKYYLENESKKKLINGPFVDYF